MSKTETKTEKDDFLQRLEDYKNDYISKNTIDSMVYENGAAVALLYKEVQHLSQLIKTYINGKEDNTTA